MIKIVLVDDHYIVRNGIKMLLDIHPNIEVVAELNSGKQVLELLAIDSTCDIVVSDINMPEMDGLQLAERIIKEYPHIKVVFLSMINDKKYLLAAFNIGVRGYLIKNINYEELLFAINHIHQGGKYLCNDLSQQMIEDLNSQKTLARNVSTLLQEFELTNRELEVLYLIGDGMTNTEIADKLFLSKRTVEGHRQHLIDKTGAKNSASLIKYAVLNGLIN